MWGARLVCAGFVAAACIVGPAVAQEQKPWHPELTQINDLLTEMAQRIRTERENVTAQYDVLALNLKDAAAKRLAGIDTTALNVSNDKTVAQVKVDESKAKVEALKALEQPLSDQIDVLDAQIRAAEENVRIARTDALRDLEERTRLSDKRRQDTHNLLVMNQEGIAQLQELIHQMHMTPSVPIRYKKIELTDNGKPSAMGTLGFGGGFDPSRNVFVFPVYAVKNAAGSQAVTYDAEGKRVVGADMDKFGSEKLGGKIMQLWFESDGTFFSAHYDSSVVRKSQNGKVAWSTDLFDQVQNEDASVTGVCADNDYVYAVMDRGNKVFILNKKSGAFVRTLELTGGAFHKGSATAACGKSRGAVAVGEGKFFYGCSESSVIHRYDLKTGVDLGHPIFTHGKIEVSAFDGEFMCVSDRSSRLDCYRLLDENVHDKVQELKDTAEMVSKKGIK